MCLGVPGQVQSIDGLEATVDFWGVEKGVRLDTVDDPVEPGDYILNHVGFAIRRIPEGEIDDTMALYKSFIDGDPDDLLAEDVADEIEAGGSVPAGAGDGTAADDATDGNTTEEEPADAEDAEDLLDELDIDV
jgi:hydrogenase expression/formation protein HypC